MVVDQSWQKEAKHRGQLLACAVGLPDRAGGHTRVAADSWPLKRVRFQLRVSTHSLPTRESELCSLRRSINASIDLETLDPS